MNILVTGGDGFIGKNLIARLNEIKGLNIFIYGRRSNYEDLAKLINQADSIIHLAAVNRPINLGDYLSNNVDLTRRICKLVGELNRTIPIIFASSAQVQLDNPYGLSKKKEEELLSQLVIDCKCPVAIYRLPGVFGKWCKPNYNSVVATYCHNIARGLSISINELDRSIELVFIDDVVDEFIKMINSDWVGLYRGIVGPVHYVTLKYLADSILSFRNSRKTLILENIGLGFLRALYSTYVSYIPIDQLSYQLNNKKDVRGNFVEILKTQNSGQFSYLTIKPGVIRGSHYHHTKTEKFLVVCGSVVMNFRNLITGETHKIHLTADIPTVVDSMPGWVHDIYNDGISEAVVILWANELFNPEAPDTISMDVKI